MMNTINSLKVNICCFKGQECAAPTSKRCKSIVTAEKATLVGPALKKQELK